MISCLPSTIECPLWANSFHGGSERYTVMNCIVLFLNGVVRGQCLQSVLVYNFTNMHAMTYRSDLFPCSCRVNIEEPGVCFTVTLFSAVSPVELPSILIPTSMSDSKSLNTSLLQIMISSKHQRAFICDVGDLPVQIIFDTRWTSMNIGCKRHIAWNNSRYAPGWWFILHCEIEETGSPGIICIMCHQVLRHPSEHGTSSIRKRLQATAHIAKLNKLTELDVSELTSSTVDEPALAILKRQASQGITTVSSQRKIISDILVDTYWPK